MNLSPLFVIISTAGAGLLGLLIGYIIGAARSQNENDWDRE